MFEGMRLGNDHLVFIVEGEENFGPRIFFTCARAWLDKLGIFHAKHLYVLIHIRIKGEVGTWKLAEALQLFSY